MMDAIRAFIQRFNASSTNPRYLEWGELIHHAAVYTDYLIIVPEAVEDDRAELVLALSKLHGNSFDMATLSGSAETSWREILSCIREALGSEQHFDDTLDMAEHCVSVAEHRYAAAGNLLIAVDHSEKIPAEILNQIAHFALLGQRYIVFVLLGEPGFADVIREGPAQAMKQYLPDPAKDTARIVHHDRVGDRVGLWFDKVLLARLKQSPRLVGFWKPIAQGGFPLAHTVAATLAIVGLVVGALFWPAEENAEFKEVVLQENPAPVRVDSSVLSEVAEPAIHYADVAPDVADTSDGRYQGQELPISSPEPQTIDKVSGRAPVNVPRELEPLAFSEHYTIQLIGVRDQTAALAYMKRWSHQVAQPLGFLETRLKNKPWYVVVAGRFDDKQVAKQAIQTLPVELKNSKPWIRLTKTPVSWLK
ncbi:MAG: SPOR domain-containing protein [Oceanobacter sp.]